MNDDVFGQISERLAFAGYSDNKLTLVERLELALNDLAKMKLAASPLAENHLVRDAEIEVEDAAFCVHLLEGRLRLSRAQIALERAQAGR